MIESSQRNSVRDEMLRAVSFGTGLSAWMNIDKPAISIFSYRVARTS